MAVAWSKIEVDLIITDYMSMLSEELMGKDYNKAEHRRALIKVLKNRSEGSVERKHQNISALLIALGYPYIVGYKPLGHYQTLLHDRLVKYLSMNVGLSDTVATAVDSPVKEEVIENYLDRLVSMPVAGDWVHSGVREKAQRSQFPTKINYLEREARNASLGLAGERFVVDFERARLANIGFTDLARRVEHVSVTLGDGLGFDIRSFEEDGTDRLIEVKTTAGGKHTPFFLSHNELEMSRKSKDHYHLYRVFTFRDDPHLFFVQGALDSIFKLEATQYKAWLG